MPNLNLIYDLKKRFSQLNETDKQVQDYLEKSEAKDILDDVLYKAFNSDLLLESRGKTKLFSFINENLSPDKPEIVKYFDEGKEEDVALLFIDITDFSKTIQGWTNNQMKTYLDDYYNEAIPIIYSNHGEIEKLMGDGIICVFGKPFLNVNSPEYVYHAEQCAEDIIKRFHGTNKKVKVAIHKGRINYYKVPGDHYGEYTMIGQPITDLYRLESVSKSNAINFYGNSSYDNLGWYYSIFDDNTIKCRGFDITPLQGVNFSQIKYIKFPGYL